MVVENRLKGIFSCQGHSFPYGHICTYSFPLYDPHPYDSRGVSLCVSQYTQVYHFVRRVINAIYNIPSSNRYCIQSQHSEKSGAYQNKNPSFSPGFWKDFPNQSSAHRRKGHPVYPSCPLLPLPSSVCIISIFFIKVIQKANQNMACVESP